MLFKLPWQGNAYRQPRHSDPMKAAAEANPRAPGYLSPRPIVRPRDHLTKFVVMVYILLCIENFIEHMYDIRTIDMLAGWAYAWGDRLADRDWAERYLASVNPTWRIG